MTHHSCVCDLGDVSSSYTDKPGVLIADHHPVPNYQCDECMVSLLALEAVYVHTLRESSHAPCQNHVPDTSTIFLPEGPQRNLADWFIPKCLCSSKYYSNSLCLNAHLS